MSDPVGIPTPIAIQLEGSNVKFVAGPPSAVPTLSIISYLLFRGPTATYSSSTWTQVGGAVPFAEILNYVNLYDTSPLFGHTTFYAVQAVRSDGVLSALSAALSITPSALASTTSPP